MAKLTFGMMVSLDGYINDRNGNFSWGQIDDDVLQHTTEEGRRSGTEIYGRRMYETMVYWETHLGGAEYEAEFARIWQGYDKIVVSKSLTQVSSKRTRIVESLSADEVLRLKRDATKDITVSGPTLAASLIAEGLVDEIGIYYVPVAVGGGTPFFKDLTTLVKFERIEEQSFKNGMNFMRYRLRK